MRLNTFTNILIMSVLSLGLAEVAQADMKWVETLRGFCPTVCQKNAENKYNKENARPINLRCRVALTPSNEGPWQ